MDEMLPWTKQGWLFALTFSKDIFPTCPRGKTLHILPQRVLRDTVVSSLSGLEEEERHGGNGQCS